MRRFVPLALMLGLTLGLLSSAALADDSKPPMDTPSSTIPGCLNDWSPMAYADTCEGKVAKAAWDERAAQSLMAVNILSNADRFPDKADVIAVRNAIDGLAAMVDAAEAAYVTQPRQQNPFVGYLAWLRKYSEIQTLPIPDRAGDFFRSQSARLRDPALLKAERNRVYIGTLQPASSLHQTFQQIASQVLRETDSATRAAHVAAKAAESAVRAGETPDADQARPAITDAAKGNAALAEGQITQPNQSLAGHPDQGSYAARVARSFADLFSVAALIGLVILIAITAFVTTLMYGAIFIVMRVLGTRAGLRVLGVMCLRQYVVLPVTYLLVGLVVILSGGTLGGGPSALLLAVVFGVLMAGFPRLLPGPVRAWWLRRFEGEGGGSAGFADRFRSAAGTHGTARFSNAADALAGNHLAPAAPADTFALGWVPGTPKPVRDARFRQAGHILTCAPTGAGKGVGAVIPNLLDYPGSVFVLDFKGENYAVTARARREAGQAVYLIDPFGITGAPRHAMNWLDALDPADPDVVGLAGSLADMLVVNSGRESDPHWNEAAKELLRGLLIYVAGLEGERRSMSEIRRIITLPENQMIEVFADMMADPDGGQRIPARAASTQMNRPERERGSVLSTLVRHLAWLDDPRLEAAMARTDFDLRDLKRRPVSVYVALPPDRLRACLGFLRGFIGLALHAMTTVPGKPAARVAFFLDEFGQLGRMDSLVDNITILRGYGVQFWLFVQDLSQLKAVYPRWQSFMANTTQQFFGTNDFDTAKYISDTLGQFTIQFHTGSSSRQAGRLAASASQGEHLQGRALLTPDEVLRLGPDKPIVLPPGEAPYLLERINYLIDASYAGRFDENPMHTREVA